MASIIPQRTIIVSDVHVAGAYLQGVLTHESRFPTLEEAYDWTYYLPAGVWELRAIILERQSWVRRRLSQESRKHRRKSWSQLSGPRKRQLIRGARRAGWTEAQLRSRYNAGWDVSEIDPSSHGRERQTAAPREGITGEWRTTASREEWSVAIAEESDIWLAIPEEDRARAVKRREDAMAKRVVGPTERRHVA